MTDFERLTQLVTCNQHDKIKKTCAYLSHKFNLSHFGYCRIYNNGFFSYFGSNIGWCEYFATEKLYLHFPYYRHPKFVPEGFFSLNALQFKSTELILKSCLNFNIHHSLFITSKTSDGIEGFCFSAGSSNTQNIIELHEEISVLKLFTKWFKQEHSSLFKLLEKNKIDIGKQIGPKFHEQSESVKLKFAKRQNFLKTFGIDTKAPITATESRVATLTLEGYSANSIARELSRSSRTIEHHIERIKEKLLCDSKHELIKKLHELELCGFLQT